MSVGKARSSLAIANKLLARHIGLETGKNVIKITPYAPNFGPCAHNISALAPRPSDATTSPHGGGRVVISALPLYRWDKSRAVSYTHLTLPTKA